MKLQNIINTACLKTAGIVGTGIHGYSYLRNPAHFRQIIDDFSEGTPQGCLRGGLSVIFPYALPYAVSLYSRRKVQKEMRAAVRGEGK
jgi:hypothetical protein